MKKLLLFDLDGTLLRSDKTVSPRTAAVLTKARNTGCLIGISTSRGEKNCLSFLDTLSPDILITSGGALIRKDDEILYSAAFSADRTSEIIGIARKVCGFDTEITVDTVDTHYWNYRTDPRNADASWGDTVYSDYIGFHEEALKICIQIFDENHFKQISELLPDCDIARFSEGYWYKFTLKGVTKEHTVHTVCEACGVSAEDTSAFGDDFSDIGMLKAVGTGIAMGNAIQEAKDAADLVIGTNDDDGIAEYLENLLP